MQESRRFGRIAAVQWLLGIMLVFAPLFRSGQPALAVLVLELFSVVLLVLVLWQPEWRIVRRGEALALGLLFLVPLLYLVPLPADSARWIPGRESYLAAQALITSTPAHTVTTLSLYPQESLLAWLFLLVPIAVFLATRLLDAYRSLQLVILVLGIGAAQSLLGLLQFGADAGSPQLFGLSVPDVASGIGTYTNRNHLAGLLEMLLPVSIALMVFSIGRRYVDEKGGWRGRIAFYASAGGHATLVYGAIALLLLLGVIFTRSRAGIALSMLGVLLSTLLFARRMGGGSVYGPTRTIIAFALGIGVAIGLVPVLDRFSAEGAVQDARWDIYSSTLDGIGAFNPIGSGPGSYPDVFRAFQPLELGHWFINHAHNDYLEWLFEAGILAAVLMALLLMLYSRQWGSVWLRGEWSRFRFVQVGAGIGIALLLLHSLVDYNLHIPANVTYFAFLAGIFFVEPRHEVETGGHKRARRRTPKLENELTASAPPLDEAPVVPARQVENPFHDRTGSRRLSEREAAEYLGMSTAQLAALRELDQRMLEQGLEPQGPPPLWQGSDCTYSSDSLDEWIRKQTAAE